MIYIEIHPTLKVVGDLSLFITFDYNADIVNTIKQYAGSHYFKKNKTWEVPLYYFPKLIDELAQKDNITLKTIENTDTMISDNQDIQLEYKTKPYSYQLDGIRYGLNNDKWLLLDDPGLGKTLQLTYLAEELKHRDNIEHCLIVCGINTLKSNWKNEIEKHSKEKATILGSRINRKGNLVVDGITKRVEHLHQSIEEFFVITNIETLRDNRIIDAILSGPNKFDMIVVDEIHTCKSPQSISSKNLLKLTQARYKIGATGTLLLNNPLEVYVPLKWIGKENSIYTNFKNFYCVYDSQFHQTVIGYKNMEHLKEELKSCSLRRKKELLDLPPKIIIPEFVDMNEGQAKLYDDIKKGIKEDIDKVTLSTSNLLAAVSRLRQATACPSILTTKPIESSKINRASDLIEQIVSSGHKVVVFSTFKDTVYELKDKVKHYNPLVSTGDCKDSEIAQSIKSFQEDNNRKVLLATWQKMGTGITLTAASYMIFLDTPWTQGAFVQACDRIYRIGTKESVTIYVLIAKDTIDEHVQQLLEDKSAMSDYIIDDIISEQRVESLRKYIKDL